MLKLFSVLSHIVAGMFLFIICTLGFTAGGSAITMTVAVVILLVPAIIALIFGLSLTGFHDWRRHLGIVLLWTSLLSGVSTITMACLTNTEELQAFAVSDYSFSLAGSLVGSLIIVTLASLGWALVNADGKRAVIEI